MKLKGASFLFFLIFASVWFVQGAEDKEYNSQVNDQIIKKKLPIKKKHWENFRRQLFQQKVLFLKKNIKDSLKAPAFIFLMCTILPCYLNTRNWYVGDSIAVAWFFSCIIFCYFNPKLAKDLAEDPTIIIRVDHDGHITNGGEMLYEAIADSLNMGLAISAAVAGAWLCKNLLCDID